MALHQKFQRPLPPEAYYEWLVPADGSGVKVYAQKRDVKHLKNPPAGYADYRPGLFYVGPYELKLRPRSGRYARSEYAYRDCHR